jgi:hypothetical protein
MYFHFENTWDFTSVSFILLCTVAINSIIIKTVFCIQAILKNTLIILPQMQRLQKMPKCFDQCEW